MDVVDETLTYEAVEKPGWMSVSSSGLITGTPTNDDVGSHSVTVLVRDSAGAIDQKTFSLTVNNTNDAPLIDVGDTTGALPDAVEGSIFSHQLTVTDVDVGDSHRFSMSSVTDISWLSLDSETGLLSGTPDDEDVGLYEIVFSVEDAAGAVSTSDPITLTVNNINDPVYIDDGQTPLFRSEVLNSYRILISDEDLNDSYTFTAAGLPSWMSLDPSTGVISGTPGRADDGVYDISITVEDSGGFTDTKMIQITSSSYEYSILGLDDDFFIGDTDRDWIETGGGSDTIHAGIGDDVVVVQGQGDTTVDTGTGDDEVRVESDWSGTLLLKSGVGSNTLVIDQFVTFMEVVDDTSLKITFTNGSEIIVEDHYTIGEEGLYSVSSNGFQTIEVEGVTGIDNPYPDKDVQLIGGSDSSDIVQAPTEVNEDVVYIISTEAGDDTVYLGGGYNKAIGGTGLDTFYISSEAQNTTIYADLEGSSSIYSKANATLSPDAEGPSGGSNTDFGDAVHLGWLKSEITLTQQGAGYFRIEHADTGSVIDLYDVEELYFKDGEYKALTEGRVIGSNDWIGSANGMEIDYHQNNVRFEIKDKDTIVVKASGPVMVTEEMVEEVIYWTSPQERFAGVVWYEADYPTVDFDSHALFGGGDGIRNVEYINNGLQTYETYMDDIVIWEGSRTEVDAFDFGGTSVNVINVSSEDIAGNSVFDTVGTEGIDLIFGTSQDDMIDGKGGDDIIFGGDGDDVIIGGAGDDVLVGGDGSDILRGDSVASNDAALTAWQTAADTFNTANAGNTITFDENLLSLDDSGMLSNDGNDVIIGGDGLDDIKSGDGRNFVTSGKADIDGDGQANLDLINQNIDNHEHLLNDEEWV